jgi:hypothetical protein
VRSDQRSLLARLSLRDDKDGEDDYVYDIYDVVEDEDDLEVQRIMHAQEESGDSGTKMVGVLMWEDDKDDQEDVFRLLEVDSDAGDDVLGDQDSNAEDYWANEYPDEDDDVLLQPGHYDSDEDEEPSDDDDDWY